MKTFYIGLDYTTAERVGALEMFQVDTLLDENEDNITNRIDVGQFFHDYSQLEDYLRDILEIEDEIELIEL